MYSALKSVARRKLNPNQNLVMSFITVLKHLKLYAILVLSGHFTRLQTSSQVTVWGCAGRPQRIQCPGHSRETRSAGTVFALCTQKGLFAVSKRDPSFCYPPSVCACFKIQSSSDRKSWVVADPESLKTSRKIGEKTVSVNWTQALEFPNVFELSVFPGNTALESLSRSLVFRTAWTRHCRGNIPSSLHHVSNPCPTNRTASRMPRDD